MIPCIIPRIIPRIHHAHATHNQVELPDDPRYYPVMGIRVRDSARLFSFLPGAQDPICGVCSVPLGELMPSHARHAAQREVEVEAEAERRRRAALLEAVVEEVKLEGPPRPDASNEEVTEMFAFESHARNKRDTKAAQADAHRGTLTLPLTLTPTLTLTPDPNPSPSPSPNPNPNPHRPTRIAAACASPSGTGE